ncbi:ATP-binding protein [Streptosporangium sp. NBC_01495]|uniref:ATP-binding protein n=1 Tax=Streptosporangium sp. NBC_01495 TaxID=2903899 RepID=UPI002E30DF89|nr:ATP-binding protein [Streptosporangium sp. NBC_01495]
MSADEQVGHPASDATIERWDGLCLVGQRDFPGVPQSAGTARRWVLELLDGHTATETMETLELLVSEVVTNAILHSDSAGPDGLVTVRVGLGDDVIHIEVIDDGSATSVPAIRTADGESLSGRGLSWVNLLASTWGSSQDDEAGGAVWFRLATGHPSGHGPFPSR